MASPDNDKEPEQPGQAAPDLEQPPKETSSQPPAMAPVINNTGGDSDSAPTG